MESFQKQKIMELDLKFFFEPKGIAVVGATPQASKG